MARQFAAVWVSGSAILLGTVACSGTVGTDHPRHADGDPLEALADGVSAGDADGRDLSRP